MSNWTYVSGSIGFELSPYKYKLNKDGSIKYHEKGAYEGMAVRYLPYPDEQVRLSETRPVIFYDKKEPRAGFAHTLEVSSFPIIKRDIEALMSKFSSGESNEIFYMLREADFHRCASGEFNSVQTEKIFQRIAMEKFPLWDGCSWKVYNDYRPTELDDEAEVEDAFLCIHDSIRWCEAALFYEELMDFLKALVEKDYELNNGSFHFTDVYSKIYDVVICNGVVEVRITDKDSKAITYEYYQVFHHEDKSTDEVKYPFKCLLVKVLEPVDDSWPVYEEHFPTKEEE